MAEGRIARIERADGALTMSYDVVGRVQRIEDTAGGGSALEYEYDAVDRLVRETQTSSAGTNVVAYEYDMLDRRIRRTVNGSDVTTYGWDRAGRLTSIGHAGQSTSYAYDAAGRLTTKTLPNGIVQAMSYDNGSRLTAITYTQPYGTLIETVSYVYDANGRRTSKTSASNSAAQETPFTASYDDADRMTAVTFRGTGAGGSDESCTLAYDNIGNLATKTCGTNVTSYSWDTQNRLTAISGPGVDAGFGYDALGRRVTRTVNGQATTYVYDGSQAIGETRNGVGATLLTGLQIDEAIARYAGAGNRTLLTDALGSVIAEAREERSIATRREYTPYGQSISTGEASANDSQYTARENDGTGLYFYRARYYDAQLKRFVSQDPIGLGGGINQYAYVNGNPISLTDAYGLMASMSGCASAILSSREVSHTRVAEEFLYTIWMMGLEPGQQVGASPDIDPREPRRRPIRPEIQLTFITYNIDYYRRSTYRLTELIQQLMTRCTWRISDECGNERDETHYTSSERRVLLNEQLIAQEIFSRRRDVQRHFSFGFPP